MNLRKPSLWKAAAFGSLTLFAAANCADRYDGSLNLLTILWAIMALIAAGSTMSEVRSYLRDRDVAR